MTIDAKQVARIDDDRLKGYVNRTRSGAEQVFYTGSSEQDWDRYKEDGGGRAHNVKMHDKPDTIRLQPPEKHYYSELINGEWWWVNGCAECNGQPRDWMTYIECEKHNVCRTCKASRSEITETPWGGKHGWQCNPCSVREHEEKKAEALAAMPEEYYDWDYRGQDEVKCPYCNLEVEDSGDGELYRDGDQEIDCGRCDNSFTLTTEFSPSYTMRRKEEDDE